MTETQDLSMFLEVAKLRAFTSRFLCSPHPFKENAQAENIAI